MDGVHVNVTKNTRVQGIKKRLRISRKEPFDKLLAKISSKLGIDAKILYNETGAILDDADDIKDGETLFVSQGEAFWSRNKLVDSLVAPKEGEKSKILKLGIIGPPSVGKSALTVRYIQKVFIDEYLPSFENLFKKNMVIDGEQVEVDILDSSGMDELIVMRPNWFKEREAFIMMYAINSRESFDALNVFYGQLVTFRSNVPAPIMLVGNKLDMESNRTVKKEEGGKFAEKIHADFYETSAKKDINVTQVFKDIADKLYAMKYRKSSAGGEEKKCCCNIF